MANAKLVRRRFGLWLSVLLATVGILMWFVPAVLKANHKVPEHLQVGLLMECVADATAMPQYGQRGAVTYCSNSDG